MKVDKEAQSFLQVVFSLPLDQSFTYLDLEGQQSRIGQRVEAQFGRRKLIGLVVAQSFDPPQEELQLKRILKVVDPEPLFGPYTLPLGEKISRFYLCSLGEVLFAMIPGGKREKASPLFGENVDMGSEKPLSLSLEQNQAVEEVDKAPEGSLHYLEGMTGSGKTEVFLQLAQRTLAQGKGVIYLVPEIALTHQIKKTLANRFGDGVAILHSSLTPSQRLLQWRKILRGEVKLVVGARSAIFAPLEKPGLIIIDEEHEGAYKSSGSPRYHARQVAHFLGALSGAKVLMGSATPSLEADYLMEKGALPRYILSKRLSGGELPQIELIDMKGQEGILSSKLSKEMVDTVAQGRQAIFFLNRRGYTHFFRCNSCSYELYCQQCSVPLTYHKSKNKMLCHYCGYQQPLPRVCPHCGSLDVGFVGFGTEHLEDELLHRYPDIRFRRLDTDAVEKPGQLEKTLEDFEQGRIDVLLGTQMVAKGLNFPRLKLVGIVLADTGLSMPDFRAQERTFNLIQQVSGRAGRFHPDGKVMIQTFRPQNPAIRFALKNDRRAFIAQELEMRKIQKFPPFSRLIRFVIRGKDLDLVKKGAGELGKLLGSSQEGVEILGPSPCPLELLGGNFRWQLILRGPQLGALHHVAAYVKEALGKQKGIHLELDVDPLSLM